MAEAADLPIVAEPGFEAQAEAVATHYGFLLSQHRPEGFWLHRGEEGLSLVKGDDFRSRLRVDFVGGALGHRRRFGGGRGQPLARAVGLKGGANPSVVDATAGLGGDGFILALLGCRVTLVERHPVATALVADALERAAADEELASVVGRMQLVWASALDYLPTIDAEQRPEVVYLDPMFPKRQKSALVKKEMQYFQALVGPDSDSDALLPLARAAASKRVVVKRPAGAPPLAQLPPTTTVTGKKLRYDIYIRLDGA